MRGVASAIISTGLKFMPLPSVHAYGIKAGRILFVHRLHSMVYEHILLIHDHDPMIVTLNIFVLC